MTKLRHVLVVLPSKALQYAHYFMIHPYLLYGRPIVICETTFKIYLKRFYISK